MRLFHGLIFFRYFGSLPPPADNRIVRNCDAHMPRYIHISAFPNGVRYSVLALLVLTSPVVRTTYGRLAFSAKNMRLFHGLIFFRYFGSLPPPADNRIVRNCDAHMPRYIHISAFPNGVRYSVLALLVLTSPVVRTTYGRLAFSAKRDILLLTNIQQRCFKLTPRKPPRSPKHGSVRKQRYPQSKRLSCARACGII